MNYVMCYMSYMILRTVAMIADWPSGSVRARVVRGSQSPEPLFEVTGINICLRKVTGKQGYGPITFLLCSFNTESDLVSLFQLLVFLHNTAARGILCIITCLKLCLIVVNGRNISFNQQSGSSVAFYTFFPLSVMSLFCREKQTQRIFCRNLQIILAVEHEEMSMN